MKGLLGNVVALVFGTVAALLILELGLRVAGFTGLDIAPDPLLGYHYVPHARYRVVGDKRIEEGSSAGRYNGAGWRDVEHAERKAPGTTRLLVLGDSFTAAFQVPLDSTYHRRLEAELNAHALPGHHFEVIAMGANGNGTTAEYLTYLREGARLKPDVVLLLFILNDPADNWKPVALDQGRPFFFDDGDSLRLDLSFNRTPEFRKWQSFLWLKRNLVLWTQVHLAISRLRVRAQPPRAAGGAVEEGYYRDWNFAARPPADSIPAWALTEKVLARLASQVAHDGARFEVIAGGFAQQEDHRLLADEFRDPKFDADKTQRWLAGVGARNGFDVFPLTPAFRAASVARNRSFWYGAYGHYGHWNPEGHRIAADAIAGHLARTLPGLDSTAFAVEAAPAAAAR